MTEREKLLAEINQAIREVLNDDKPLGKIGRIRDRIAALPFFAAPSAAEGAGKAPFTMEIVTIGDFTGDKIRIGEQRFEMADGALVKFPTPEDAMSAAKFLLQPTRFSALYDAVKPAPEQKGT